MKAQTGMRQVHPGEVLLDRLDVMGISAHNLSKSLVVLANHVTMVLNNQQGASDHTVLRFGRRFGTVPELWMNPQKSWEFGRAAKFGGRRASRQSVEQTSVQSVSTIFDPSVHIPDASVPGFVRDFTVRV